MSEKEELPPKRPKPNVSREDPYYSDPYRNTEHSRPKKNVDTDENRPRRRSR